MLLDPLSFLESVSATYQPVVGLIMGGEEVILVADPAAAQQVLIDKAAIYKKVGRWLPVPIPDPCFVENPCIHHAVKNTCCTLPKLSVI